LLLFVSVVGADGAAPRERHQDLLAHAVRVIAARGAGGDAADGEPTARRKRQRLADGEHALGVLHLPRLLQPRPHRKASTAAITCAISVSARKGWMGSDTSRAAKRRA